VEDPGLGISQGVLLARPAVAVTSVDGMSEVTDWRTRAACLRADPELFFPEWTGPAIDQAKQICGGCPVRARCLDWALSHRAAFGIWGGRTAAERHAMGAVTAYPVNTSRGGHRV
jgi:WhiB family transcriptional regulator, redox-sensing transcriptional regulator